MSLPFPESVVLLNKVHVDGCSLIVELVAQNINDDLI